MFGLGGLVLDPRKGGSYCDVDQAPDGTIYAIWDFGRTTMKWGQTPIAGGIS